MAIGYLLGGLFCLIYFVLVGIIGGLKRNAAILKLAKMKLNKNMSDENAARICLIIGSVIGAAGVFLLIFGAVQA